jgi:hypothetical protein
MLKKLLLLIAILVFFILMMPSITSLFAGQHSFADETNCLNCHSDIKKELDSSSYHNTLSCGNCHSNGIGVNSSPQLHDNVINPLCTDCHGNVESELNNNMEVHIPFVQQAQLEPLMKGDNEACIACHTTESISFEISFADTYQFNSARIGDMWQTTGISKITTNNIPMSVKYSGTGQHNFPDMAQFKCEKCHQIETAQIGNSTTHQTLTCNNCHQLGREVNGGNYHVAELSRCINCHTYTPDNKGAHDSFVSDASNSPEKNAACSSCHSTFNTLINYTRPSSFEWDVINNNGSWLVENMSIGPDKNVNDAKNNINGNEHDIALNVNCISCHKDINDAVVGGGHYEKSHDYSQFPDMNTYCISCHGISGVLNSSAHGATKITCLDCHGNTAPYNSGLMGGIEKSILSFPNFMQSYICIACKIAGNPTPVNGTLHFKILTEPDVGVTVEVIATPTPTPTPVPTVNITANITSTSTPVINVTPTPTPIIINITPIVTSTPMPNITIIPTSTAIQTPTPSPTPTETPTPVPTLNITPSPTPTEIPTPAPTLNITPSPTPTEIPTTTATPTPTEIPTPVPTIAPIIIPTATPTPVPTIAPIIIPTATPTPVPTIAPIIIPTATPTPVPTIAPIIIPTATPTPVPTLNITHTSTPTPVPTLNITHTPLTLIADILRKQ